MLIGGGRGTVKLVSERSIHEGASISRTHQLNTQSSIAVRRGRIRAKDTVVELLTTQPGMKQTIDVVFTSCLL